MRGGLIDDASAGGAAEGSGLGLLNRPANGFRGALTRRDVLRVDELEEGRARLEVAGAGGGNGKADEYISVPREGN